MPAEGTAAYKEYLHLMAPFLQFGYQTKYWICCGFP